MRKHLRWWTCEKCEAISFIDPVEGQKHEDECDGSPPPPEPDFDHLKELKDWAAALEKE